MLEVVLIPLFVRDVSVTRFLVELDMLSFHWVSDSVLSIIPKTVLLPGLLTFLVIFVHQFVVIERIMRHL